MDFFIEYEVISDISADLREPDTLQFKFKLQWMIRDAVTKKVLEDDTLLYSVELQPQITEEELE